MSPNSVSLIMPLSYTESRHDGDKRQSLSPTEIILSLHVPIPSPIYTHPITATPSPCPSSLSAIPPSLIRPPLSLSPPHSYPLPPPYSSLPPSLFPFPSHSHSPFLTFSIPSHHFFSQPPPRSERQTRRETVNNIRSGIPRGTDTMENYT